MNRMLQDHWGKISQMMTRNALSRVGSLAISIAFITAGASVLSGQGFSGNTTTAAGNSTSVDSAAPPRGLIRSMVPGLNHSNVGKAYVNQPFGNNGNSGKLAQRPTPIPGTQPKLAAPPTPSATSNSVTQAIGINTPTNPGSNRSTNTTVTQASHLDPNRGINLDGIDISQKAQLKSKTQNEPPVAAIPGERHYTPPIQGSMYGLSSRENTIERLSRLEAFKSELERENEELRQLNAGLQTRMKEGQEQLISMIREIQSARKELVNSRNDLDRLRGDLQGLRDKIRIAEKEHAEMLQSMGPLLQQLLESDDVSVLPQRPTE